MRCSKGGRLSDLREDLEATTVTFSPDRNWRAKLFPSLSSDLAENSAQREGGGEGGGDGETRQIRRPITMSDANKRRRRSSHAVRKDAPGEPAGVYTTLSLQKNGGAVWERWAGVQKGRPDVWLFGDSVSCLETLKVQFHSTLKTRLNGGAARSWLCSGKGAVGPPPPAAVFSVTQVLFELQQEATGFAEVP